MRLKNNPRAAMGSLDALLCAGILCLLGGLAYAGVRFAMAEYLFVMSSSAGCPLY